MPVETRPPRGLLRRLLGYGLDAVLVAATLFAVFIGYGMVGNRWYHVVTVTGGSMEPTITRGDLIVITPPPATIERGMILTMGVDGRIVTHRVMAVNADGTLVTKGDANDVADDWTGKRVTVFGQYQFAIPELGRYLPIANGSEASFLFGTATTQGIEIGSWPLPTPTPTGEVPPTPLDCVGMSFDEVILGTDGPDTIHAGNGGALVFGFGGDDTIYGGNGKDCLHGGDGDDVLVGGNGKDVLLGRDGNDTLYGGGNDDVIEGGNGKDLLDGGDGTDTCSGTPRDTFVNCETGTGAPVETQEPTVAPTPDGVVLPEVSSAPEPTPGVIATTEPAPTDTPTATPTPTSTSTPSAAPSSPPSDSPAPEPTDSPAPSPSPAPTNLEGTTRER